MDTCVDTAPAPPNRSDAMTVDVPPQRQAAGTCSVQHAALTQQPRSIAMTVDLAYCQVGKMRDGLFSPTDC
jgi:hypothetical protein